MNATVQNDNMMQRIRKMAREIEITGSTRELTELEQLMSEMLLEGVKTTEKAISSIDNAIAAAYFWWRVSRCLSVAVVVLWTAVVYILTKR